MVGKILWTVILIPIVIAVAFWGVNLITGIVTGQISLAEFLMDHRFLIGLVATYFIFKHVSPFRKD